MYFSCNIFRTLHVYYSPDNREQVKLWPDIGVNSSLIDKWKTLIIEVTDQHLSNCDVVFHQLKLKRDVSNVITFYMKLEHVMEIAKSVSRFN